MGKDQEEIGEVVIEKRKKVSSVVQERSCETEFTSINKARE